MGARVPAAPCVRGGKSLAALVQAATTSRLDEGNDMLGGPSASSLALFSSIFYWPLTFSKNNSYITLLPVNTPMALRKV